MVKRKSRDKMGQRKTLVKHGKEKNTEQKR